MLTSSDIRRMRDEVDRVLPGTAVISTLSQVSDGMGGFTDTYAASGTVDARLDYASATEQTIAARITEQQSFVLTVPNDTTIAESGRVTYDSEDYEVIAVLPREPWDLCQRAILTRFA